MAKAKRERRNSFRTMQADQALEALDRIEQMEREEQQTADCAGRKRLLAQGAVLPVYAPRASKRLSGATSSICTGTGSRFCATPICPARNSA